MKSKITKIQVLKKGIAIALCAMFLATPITYATTCLDDSYLESSLLNQLLYGKVGSTVKEIEEYFVEHTTLYITNETQLRALAEYVNIGNDCSGKEIILLNDIEVNSEDEWVPIGKSGSKSFQGLFDGKGHTISGVTYLRESKSFEDLRCIGLFGVIGGNGIVKNLVTENFNIDIYYTEEDNIENITDVNYYYHSTGNIAGYCNGTIENCISKSNISGTYNVGGIVGTLNNGTIKNCSNYGLVKGYQSVGGILGKAQSENNVIENNINVGNISGSKINIGGIVGFAGGNIIRITNCTNQGEITGSSKLGGIVGRDSGENTEIINCLNKGKINGGIIGERIGGILGETESVGDGNLSDLTIENCTNEAEIKGKKIVGGIVGLTNKETNNINRCLNSGDINSTDNNIGGIIGWAGNEAVNEINQCINKGTLQTTADNAGGIIGYTAGEAKLSIDNCLNEGKIIANNLAGGIIGQAQKAGELSITACTNKASITADNNVGGIIGKTDRGTVTVETCINEGDIQANNDNAGGIVGFVSGKFTVKNCCNEGDITAIANMAGPIIGKGDCYEETDFLTANFCLCEGNVNAVLFAGFCIGGVYGDINRVDFENCIMTDNGSWNMNSTTGVPAYENYTYGSYVPCTNNNLILPAMIGAKVLWGAQIYNQNDIGANINEENIGFRPIETAEMNLNVTFGSTNVKYTVYKNDKEVTNNEYFKVGDILKIVASFDKYLAKLYGPLTAITEAPILKINDSIEMTAGEINASNSEYITTIEYTYTIGNSDNFEIKSLDMYKVGTIYTVGSDYATVHPEIEVEKVAQEVDGIVVDATAPTVSADMYVENSLETRRYIAGKEILIDVTTSEKINADYIIPEIQISFSESGIGRYNYSEKEGKVGYAKCIDAKINLDASTTWTYIYQIQEFDEGNVIVTYKSGEITDNVGNKTEVNTLKAEKTEEIYADTTAPTISITRVKELGEEYDFNSDGTTNQKDVILLAKYVAGWDIEEEIKDSINTKGDIDNSNNIDLEDIIQLVEKMAVKDNTTNESKINFVVTLSEEVKGFDILNDITVNNGTIKEYEYIEAENLYVIVVEPEIEEGNVGELQLIVEQDAFQDLVGQSNVREERIVEVDRRAPILQTLEAYATSNIKVNEEIDIVKENYREEDTITVVATFDENITGDTSLAIKFSESGNVKEALKGVVSGNKITYTYTIKDGDKGILSVRALNGAIKDIAGNETTVTRKTLDGNVIIADTKDPVLNELKVTSSKKANKSGDPITIEAVYSEEVYALITKEDGTKEIVNISNDNAPKLDISFVDKSLGEVAAKGNMTAKYATKEDGTPDKTRIIYTYIVKGEETEGDNGDLVINLPNSQVCDIAGNTSNNIPEEKDTNKVKADTTRPLVTNITAEGKSKVEGITHNGIEFYKAGSAIDVTVESNEVIATDVITVYYAFKDTQPTDEEYKEHKEGHLNIDNSKEFRFTIDVEDGENGFLWVKVLDNAFTDEAGNGNVLAERKIEKIYADTTDPYLATNTDGKAEWKIEKNTNEDGIVTGITVTGIFNEKVFSMSGNKLISLKDIPTLGVFVNNELKKKAGEPDVDIRENEETTLDDQTILTYKVDITDIDTKGNISVNFIDGTVYDRAGNQMSIDLTEGDVTSPIFKDIKVVTPNDFYKAGEIIEIVARFEEETKLTDIPTLKIRIGDSVKEIAGEEYNKDDIENTETIKVARYKYPITEEDTGALNIISLIGTVSDGVRPREISQIYIDTNEDEIDDVNGKAEELLNSTGIEEYTNNDEEYKNVIVDNKEPYITSVEAIIKGKEEPIASYVKEEGKDSVTKVGRINTNEIEYIITFSELVENVNESEIKLYNGEIEDIIYNNINVYNHFNQITIKATTTTEGVQSLIFDEGIFVDRAGNTNEELERFNMVTTDFTQPSVRFISEYNGGVYVLPTNVEKIEIRPNVEISEDIDEIYYKWKKLKDGKWEDIAPYAEVENYTSSSDIAIDAQTFGEGSYKLYIKVVDLAGNEYETKEGLEYKIIESSIDIEPNTTSDTNQDVIVEVTFGEGLTDNKKVVFKPVDSTETQELRINEEGKYVVDTESNGNGTIYVEATDRVGNKVYNELSITNIDTEDPVVEFELDGADLIIGTRKDKATIKTNVELKDNMTEYPEAKYVFLQEDIDIYNMTEEQKTALKAKITNELIGEAKIDDAVSTKDNGPYYLYILAVDNAGNETIAKSRAFTVANTNPTGEENTIPAEIEINKLISFEQKGKVIYISYNNFSEEEEYLNIIREKEISLTNERDGYIDYEYYSYVEVKGATTITVKGTDICGNQVIATHEVTKDSIEGPEFEIIGNPKDWTNQDVKLEVSCYEALSALTVNGTDILSKEEGVRSNTVVTQNGDYEFIATDTYGNISKKTITVSKIDKELPVISEVVNEGKDITITATDEGSGIAEYAISTTTEDPVEWSKSKVIKVTEDGTFYAWAKDNAGNISRAENAIVIDTTAPIVTFNYLSQTVTVGMPLEANVFTNEDAIISYSWDKQTWVNSEELISSMKVSEKTTTPGEYTLYVKATDNNGNESKVQALEFNVVNIEEIRQPEIIFEDIPTIQINGAKYIKVSSDMTTQGLTNKMDQEALCGKTPEYTKLTEDKDLKTGSEIAINGSTKYIVVVEGDMNCDGKVTFDDIIKTNAVRISAAEDSISKAQLLAVDINNTAKIEFKDIISINAIRINSANQS